MTLPGLDFLCKEIDALPNDLCLTLPGGAQICNLTEGMPPSLLGFARSALGQASSALAPLTPIFDIIETIVAIQKCVTAIPDALGPPPDPSKLVECLPELAKRIEKVISLLPPASVLHLIADLLDMIIALIDGSIAELQAIIALIERITKAQLMAGSVPGLLGIIDCGNQSKDVAMDNLERAFASINPLIDLLNELGGLAHLPKIPSFEGGLPGDPAAAIAQLGVISEVLQGLRDAIPL